GRRSQHLTGGRHAVDVHQLRDPEVRQLHARPFEVVHTRTRPGSRHLEQDVFRLDVAVDHSLLVGVLQGTGDLQGNLCRKLDGQQRLFLEQLPKGDPFDQFDDQVTFVLIVFRDVENLYDVRM